MVTHEIAAQAFGSRAEKAPLTLVQRSDEDFIAGLLADLATDAGRKKVASATPEARPKDGVLQLFQPVHRTFHLALLELFCKEPGFPRLDPTKIESTGLVVRRVAVPRAGSDALEEVNEAWVKQPNGEKSWEPLADEEWDPDPKRRHETSAGNGEVDRLLDEQRRAAIARDPRKRRLVDAEEHVTTVFIAPKEVCCDAKRTILYGLVPTASADTSTAPAAAYTEADLDQVVPQYLGGPRIDPRDSEPAPLPSDLRGKTLTRYDAERLEGRPFFSMLALLTIALGLYPRDASGPSPAWGKALIDALDRLTIRGERGSVFLGRAARVLVWRTDGEVTMPDQWPTIPADVKRAIRDAMGVALEAQAKRIVPNEGRFEVARAEYEARAFVRIRCPKGCPPKILWSEPSKRFVIRPWHAAGPLPPHRVTLPDIVPDKLGAVQPNVTFVVPKGLAGFLNSNTAKSLLKGSGTKGSGGIGLICGFNIPIITICAFIVLSIILSLLNLIFWWLPLVKICIPFPSSLAKRLEE